MERQSFGGARAKPLAGLPFPPSWFCQETRNAAADKTMGWDRGRLQPSPSRKPGWLEVTHTEKWTGDFRRQSKGENSQPVL